MTITGRDGGLLVRVITGGRERPSTVSASGGTGRLGRRGGVLLVLSAALGCTVTGDDFEPARVVPERTETEGLGPQAPSLPTPSPTGNAPARFPTPEEEGIEPNGALDPADMASNANGAGSAGSVLDAGADGGVEVTDAGALDAGAPRSAPPTTPDASTPTEPEPNEPEPTAPEPADPEPNEPEPTAPEPTDPEPAPPCPGIVFDRSCYQFSAERVSWSVAEERCVALGGHLASIETFEEDFFIAVWPALLGVPVGDGSGIWLGGSDEGQDGDFRWAERRSLSFQGWAPNQPDNGQGVDCIQKRNDGTARWYDLRCTDAQPYVCERAE